MSKPTACAFCEEVPDTRVMGAYQSPLDPAVYICESCLANAAGMIQDIRESNAHPARA